MSTSFGQSILSVFDVWEDSSSFLSEVLESGDAPNDEVQCLFDQSLTGGAEDWHYLIDCARSIRCVQNRHPKSLDGSDILSFVWEIFDGYDGGSPSAEPWGETDRLIALAKNLEREIEILPPSLPTSQPARKSASSRAQSRVKKQRLGTTSHYWSDELSDRTSKTNDKQGNLSFANWRTRRRRCIANAQQNLPTFCTNRHQRRSLRRRSGRRQEQFLASHFLLSTRLRLASSKRSWLMMHFGCLLPLRFS